MTIKKLGHCCLVLNINGKRIMTDPGSYSVLQNDEKNIDIIVITHEHQDHFHIESLKILLRNNPNAIVITNTSVGKILEKDSIEYKKIEDGESGEFLGVKIEGYGTKHEEIYGNFGQVENTGYFIGEEIFYPGDAFTNPNKYVPILALPIAGPWMKIKIALDYALTINPKVCFPVHDGMIVDTRPGPIYNLPKTILSEKGIDFKVLEINKEEEI
jgi:L-ascorbate metabolism protein UlaG (beta-lactamase superfamily)